MQEWWVGLSGATQFFFGMAAFFSVFFIWQVLAAFMGMGGDEADMIDLSDIEADPALDLEDVSESSQAFKVLSLRTIITFFTLFSWGSALYTAEGMDVVRAMGISSLWGLGGMLAVAALFYGLARLTESGTKDLTTSLGKSGTVYLDIPAGGFGEIRTLVGEVSEHVRAKSVSGEALPAGTEVKVVQVIGQTLVAVEGLNNKEKGND